MKPNDGYISYIVNPKAGATDSEPVVRRFGHYLAQKGFDVRISNTDSLEHACELATNSALDGDCGLVIAAGGDGVVREVAHGLEGSGKPLLIVPCGTENLLANELGLNKELKALIKNFEAGFIRPLDLGIANGKCFTSVVGFGFDGDIIKLVSDQRQGHIYHISYIGPIWRTFWSYRFPSIKVQVDGEEIFNGPGLVFVGNISRYALGMQLLRYADFGDGLLDVCVYKCDSKVKLAGHSVLTILKKHTKTSGVIYRQGKNIVVSADCGDIKTEIDGDPGPPLPMEISVIPDAVKVMVPEGTKPAGIRARLLRMFE